MAISRYDQRKNYEEAEANAIGTISFFLIADIDSLGGGVIRVRPQNLVSLAPSIRGHE
jgi:hypothetical protein